MKKYATTAGRCIEIDGQPFATIHKCEGVDPCAADQFAREISELFNAREYDVDRESRNRENLKGALDQAWAQMASIEEMVDALECDYARLADLQDEKQALQDAITDAETPEEIDTANGEMIEWFKENGSEFTNLVDAAGDCENEDEARERINEDPLEVQIRSDWFTPSETPEPSEYKILLCTGGPAVRIVGELGQFNEPSTAKIEYQDWFTPWTELQDEDERKVNESALLTYARCFYFGE